MSATINRAVANLNVFGITRVLDTCLSEAGDRMYKVEWKPSWEAESNLKQCETLLSEYWSKSHGRQEISESSITRKSPDVSVNTFGWKESSTKVVSNEESIIDVFQRYEQTVLEAFTGIGKCFRKKIEKKIKVMEFGSIRNDNEMKRSVKETDLELDKVKKQLSVMIDGLSTFINDDVVKIEVDGEDSCTDEGSTQLSTKNNNGVALDVKAGQLQNLTLRLHDKISLIKSITKERSDASVRRISFLQGELKRLEEQSIKGNPWREQASASAFSTSPANQNHKTSSKSLIEKEVPVNFTQIRNGDKSNEPPTFAAFAYMSEERSCPDDITHPPASTTNQHRDDVQKTQVSTRVSQEEISIDLSSEPQVKKSKIDVAHYQFTKVAKKRLRSLSSSSDKLPLHATICNQSLNKTESKIDSNAMVDLSDMPSNITIEWRENLYKKPLRESTTCNQTVPESNNLEFHSCVDFVSNTSKTNIQSLQAKNPQSPPQKYSIISTRTSAHGKVSRNFDECFRLEKGPSSVTIAVCSQSEENPSITKVAMQNSTLEEESSTFPILDSNSPVNVHSHQEETNNSQCQVNNSWLQKQKEDFLKRMSLEARQHVSVSKNRSNRHLFATHLLLQTFTNKELTTSNIEGTKGKRALDPIRFNFVINETLRLYPIFADESRDEVLEFLHSKINRRCRNSRYERKRGAESYRRCIKDNEVEKLFSDGNYNCVI